MTLTKLALDDVQQSVDLRAAVEALLTDGPQTFTPLPPPPGPAHLEEAETEHSGPTRVVEMKTRYYADERCSTGDMVGAHFVASFADRQ